MTMDAKTAEALEASIEKWKRNAEVRDIKEAKILADSCPLCALYVKQACDGCPVSEQTGQADCGDSPWDDAYDAHSQNDLPAFRLAAQAEVEFLESLREAVEIGPMESAHG